MLWPAYFSAIPAGPLPGSAERRKRARFRVHWPLRFRGDSVEAVTEDLSSEGFYFHAVRPLVPGEVRVCRLTLPAHDADEQSRHKAIECRVHVVRVESLAGGAGYGVGCRILDYRLWTQGAEFMDDGESGMNWPEALFS